MLELWGMQSTHSLTSHPSPVMPGMVAPEGLNRTKLAIYAKLNCLI